MLTALEEGTVEPGIVQDSVYFEITKIRVDNTCSMFYPAQVCIFIVHRPLSGNALRFIEKITFSMMLFDGVQ